MPRPPERVERMKQKMRVSLLNRSISRARSSTLVAPSSRRYLRAPHTKTPSVHRQRARWTVQHPVRTATTDQEDNARAPVAVEVEELLQHIEHARHLREYEHPVPVGLQPLQHDGELLQLAAVELQQALVVEYICVRTKAGR